MTEPIQPGGITIETMKNGTWWIAGGKQPKCPQCDSKKVEGSIDVSSDERQIYNVANDGNKNMLIYKSFFECKRCGCQWFITRKDWAGSI